MRAMTRSVAQALSILALTLGTCWPAFAEFSSNIFLKNHKEADLEGKQLLEELARATENGMAWVSAVEKRQVYCHPPNLVLTGSQIVDILRRESAEVPAIAEAPYGLGILLSLKRTFPCDNKR